MKYVLKTNTTRLAQTAVEFVLSMIIIISLAGAFNIFTTEDKKHHVDHRNPLQLIFSTTERVVTRGYP